MTPNQMPATGLTKAEQLKLIWRHEHRDYKGHVDGKRAVLVFRTGIGTCLVQLEALTPLEIANKLPFALRRERARQLRNDAKVRDAIRSMGINPL